MAEGIVGASRLEDQRKNHFLMIVVYTCNQIHIYILNHLLCSLYVFKFKK
jgi:hypothetical protein